MLTDASSSGAGMYTHTRVVAPSVSQNRQKTPSDDIRAVIVNSGNANACTGQRGMNDSETMSRLAASACDLRAEQVLVMSTGIIGEPLDMAKISKGIESAAQQLGSTESSLIAAARGMMTTDTVHKIAGREILIDGKPVLITGMAKGAGMIGPRMATMLAVLMTDARLPAEHAPGILQEVVDDTFNCISVDGHVSTNDTVLLLASGKAANGPLVGPRRKTFTGALHEVCVELARSIPSDGEGASHLIEIEVRGCATKDDARKIAQAIANSPLVKTAIAGADPNWGRIISAAGYAGVDFSPEKLELRLNGTALFRKGSPIEHDAKAVSRSIRDNHETKIVLELDQGNACIRFWTSDLTLEYIRINAEYHT